MTDSDALITFEEHASALRQIAKTGNLWPEAVEELNVIAQKLEAAPDMLAALEELRDNLEQFKVDHLRNLGLLPAMEKLGAAIAKAKGAS